MCSHSHSPYRSNHFSSVVHVDTVPTTTLQHVLKRKGRTARCVPPAGLGQTCPRDQLYRHGACEGFPLSFQAESTLFSLPHLQLLPVSSGLLGKAKRKDLASCALQASSCCIRRVQLQPSCRSLAAAIGLFPTP